VRLEDPKGQEALRVPDARLHGQKPQALDGLPVGLAEG
jgi:hypothetical protein